MDEIDDFASPLGDDANSAWLDDLFQSTRAPGTAEELSSEADVVGAMARTIAQPPLIADINDRRRRISKTATRTAIAAAALLVGTSTAAATGNLPDAAQSAVSRASSHLGVDIPDPYDGGDAGESDGPTLTTDPSTTDPATISTVHDASALPLPLVDDQSTTDTTSMTADPGQALPESTDPPGNQSGTAETTSGSGPDVTGPAKQGLCRAWVAHGGDSPANQNSTAMKNLQAAAAAAGQTVAEFCAEALEPDSTEVATTTTEASTTTTVADKGNKDKDKDKDKNKDKDKKQKK